ncbi:MAG TPA: hypothetical protein VFX49_03575 [Chloroflexota bacterium]|nr:hypothetical protein [Chloroflexota bacterium]
MRNPKLAGVNRRDFNRLVAGAGASAALAPRGAGIASAAAPARLSAQGVERGDNIGVNEAFKAMAFGTASGAGWTRYTVQWFNVQPQPGPLNEHYFRDNQGRSILEAQVNAGVKVAAMVLGTPEWAAAVPGLKTGTSVPRGLYTDAMVGDQPNPENPWAVFMFNLAKSYAGLMDVFEIWNEVEIPTGGSNAVYNTWAGSAADYYRLLAVASEAVKAVNPFAKIVTSPYSYFKDQQEGEGQRLPWFDDFMAAVRAGGAHVFDAVALNLYRNPHDLWDRMWGGMGGVWAGANIPPNRRAGEPLLDQKADLQGFRARLDAAGAQGKELWITELNAMPYDDPVPGWNTGSQNDGFRITMAEQSSYVLQAYGTALAAGWNKVFFQALQDDPYPVPDELWGLVRFNSDSNNNDPSRARPAYGAFQLAASALGNADNVDLHIRVRADNPRDRYRQYASRYKWGAHAVVADKGAQRSYILWNGSETDQPVTIQAWGAEATLYVPDGAGNYQPQAISPSGNQYNITLPRATRHFELFGGDPPNYFYVGGPTYLLVEQGVPGGAGVSLSNFTKKDRRPDTQTDPDARD